MAISPDGTTMATGHGRYPENGSVVLWDVTDRTNPRQLGDPLSADTVDVTSVAFSADGTRLAAGTGIDDTDNDGSVVLWDVTDRTNPRQLGDPLDTGTEYVSAVAFSPDGATLAAGTGRSFDTNTASSVVLWDVTDRQAPRQLGDPLPSDTRSVNSVAFSPDGATLATGIGDGTGSVVLWDLADREAPRQLGDPLHGDTRSVSSVAFSSDGATLATGIGDDNGSVVLWDVTDRQAPRQLGDPLPTNTGYVYSVVFSPDGATLATGTNRTKPDGSNEGSVVLKDLTGLSALRADLPAHACRRAGRGFTPEEWARYVPDLPYQDVCARPPG